MKRILFIVSAFLPMLAFADIIVQKDGNNIEDVSVTSITAEKVTYSQSGAQKTIASSMVEGVLYDNGRYVTPPSAQAIIPIEEPSSNEYSGDAGSSWDIDDAPNQGKSSNRNYDDGNAKRVIKASKTTASNDEWATDDNTYSTSKSSYSSYEQVEINVLAYGKQVLNFYSVDHEFDGTTIEYRVITPMNPNPEFEYLGTAPFAYLTDTEAKVLTALDKKIVDFISIRPLMIDKGGKIEFRLSKEGYQTVIVKPMIKVDFGGRLVMVPLNKLK